jgi:hypothetical protein
LLRFSDFPPELTLAGHSDHQILENRKLAHSITDFLKVFAIVQQPSPTAKPAKCTLHNPTQWTNRKTFGIASPDRFNFPSDRLPDTRSANGSPS